MRTIALLSVLSVLILGSATDAVAASKPSRVLRISLVRPAQSAIKRATFLVARTAQRRSPAARPSGNAGPKARLSSLEVDIVARINAQRGARGLRSLRVSRGLTAAA